jgi:hypothetical protein
MVLIQLVGIPLVGKRETLQALAKRSGKRIEAFELQAPASQPWPALSVHGLAATLDAGLKIECFSGGVPPNAQKVALARANAFVVVLDPQADVQDRNRDFFSRNREAILLKPRIYQLTKGDLAPRPRVVDVKAFGQQHEPVIETNLLAGTGFDALHEEIMKLARLQHSLD